MSNESAAKVTYKDAGVDIDKADNLKARLKETLTTSEARVLNTVGAFSSLFDLSDLPDISQPVLCLKMEEPGSKQLLASQHGRLPDVGYDLVNHLINDTVMNGGRPLAILDTIVCGKLDPDTVSALIKVMVEACKAEGCTLVGGETSEQPRVLTEETYILSAACVGVVDKKKIIDGLTIADGDLVYGVASNGIHTNGYTLIRTLIDKIPSLLKQDVSGESFLDAVLRPHLCYNTPLQEVFKETSLHGLSHITGGGVVDNLKRIIPSGMSAELDLSKIEVLPVFKKIQEQGNIQHDEMLRTFNCGVGMIFVGQRDDCERASQIFSKHGCRAYQIGSIAKGQEPITTTGKLSFS